MNMLNSPIERSVFLFLMGLLAFVNAAQFVAAVEPPPLTDLEKELKAAAEMEGGKYGEARQNLEQQAKQNQNGFATLAKGYSDWQVRLLCQIVLERVQKEQEVKNFLEQPVISPPIEGLGYRTSFISIIGQELAKRGKAVPFVLVEKLWKGNDLNQWNEERYGKVYIANALAELRFQPAREVLEHTLNDPYKTLAKEAAAALGAIADPASIPVLVQKIEDSPDGRGLTMPAFDALLHILDDKSLPVFEAQLKLAKNDNTKEALSKLIAKIHSDQRVARNEGIHELAKTGDMKKLKELLDRKPELVNAEMDNGSMPLHMASFGGQVDMVKFLLNRGANVNAKDHFEQTPLFDAASEGHKLVVEVLIQHGADVNVKDTVKRTPLTWAIAEGHNEVADLLRQHGATAENLPPPPPPPKDIFEAASRGDLEVVKSMIEKKPELIGVEEPKERRDLATVVFMIQKQPNVFLSDEPKKKWQPLHLAVDRGHTEVVKYLLDKGADVNAKNNLNLTPLILAANRGNKEIVELLLAHKADLKITSRFGRTALQEALGNKHDDIADLLRKAGAK